VILETDKKVVFDFLRPALKGDKEDTIQTNMDTTCCKLLNNIIKTEEPSDIEENKEGQKQDKTKPKMQYFVF